ncbi:hypothetical protein K1719_016438 [Acacia pycnantha]|nr:hypothetical protein K1719_016438 [Acacia pycnantha]
MRSRHWSLQACFFVAPNLVDLWDRAALEKFFSSTQFDAVIHFAGMKSVGENVQKPLLYFDNNLIGTITLLEVMAVPIIARRFDAVIHFAGMKSVGESIQKPLLYFDNNLIGTITLLEVMAAHNCKKFVVIKYQLQNFSTLIFVLHTGCEVYNLGTGKGTSVLEIVRAFEKASGKKIPLVMAGHRLGDAEIVYASTKKAERELKWTAKYGIEEMRRDHGSQNRDPDQYDDDYWLLAVPLR